MCFSRSLKGLVSKWIFGGTGVSDCVLGSTENRISGSNPSFSATIFVVEITYEFAFLQVEFSPLSRGLRELDL